MAPKGDMQITMVRPAQLTDVSIGRCDKRFYSYRTALQRAVGNFPCPAISQPGEIPSARYFQCLTDIVW
jgi:hypothetical protein